MKTFLMVSWISSLLNGLFGSPEYHVKAISDDLTKAKQQLDKGAYQHSFESTKDAEDEFNYIYRLYPHKEGNQWLKELDEFEAAISVLNIPKSKLLLEHIQKDWNALRDHPL